MFLQKFFKRLEQRRLEKAEIEKKREEKRLWKQKYWEISEYIYKAMMDAYRKTDNSMPDLEYECSLGDIRAFYKVDEKLSVKIHVFFPDIEKSVELAYEAVFYIDNIPIDIDFDKYTELGLIVCETLKKKITEYEAKKASIVDDYRMWRKCKEGKQ